MKTIILILLYYNLKLDILIINYYFRIEKLLFQFRKLLIDNEN
jgi:hypothetical protein